MLTLNGFSQDSDYYYYKSKKVNLYKSNSRHYVLTNKSENEMTVKLSEDNFILEKMYPNKVRNSFSNNKENKNDGNWAVVKGSSNLKENDWVTYSAPFYYTDDQTEVGLSHLFYVKLKKEQDLAILNELAKTKNVEILGQNDYMPLWFTLACSKESNGNALQLANYFFETGKFAASEPDFLVDGLTHNPNYPNQWGLNNTGQNNGNVGIDINAPEAWNITQGQQNVVVAVIDHGIELNHPDLLNISPISFDTETNTSPSVVHDNHGTACAGIVGASDNLIGSVGVAPNCTLMSISNELVLDINVRQELANGLNFAWQNGASVISNSWGHVGLQGAFIDDAITAAINQGRNGLGCIVVFSSGNDNGNVGYPANSNPDILAVGAMSQCGERKSPTSCDTENSWGSNFGNELDIVAPGVLIPTTDRQGNNGYNPNVPIHTWAGGTLVVNDYADQDYTRWFNGTSSACPHVAGVAALVLSVNPSFTGQQVRDIIESTTQKIGVYNYASTSGRSNGTWDDEMGYGLVDAFAAVEAALPVINGGDLVCNSPNKTYTISNTTDSVLTWQVSSNLQIVSSSNTQVTVKATSNGAAFIQATTASVTVSKDIWAGTRYIEYVEFANSFDGENYFCSSHTGNTYTLYPKIKGNTYQYRILEFPSLNVLYTSPIISGNSGTVYYTPSPGWYVFEARMTNACGTSVWTGGEVEYVDCSTGGGGGEGEARYAIYPNPASSEINISYRTTNTKSSITVQNENITQLTLYDFVGNVLIEKISGNLKNLNISNMTAGMYYLEVRSSDIKEIHRIIIEK